MERIRVVGMFNVPGERLAEFKKAAAQLVEVANRGAGTLQYDWYSNKDETAWVCLEQHEDSAAFLTHMANPGQTPQEVGGVQRRRHVRGVRQSNARAAGGHHRPADFGLPQALPGQVRSESIIGTGPRSESTPTAGSAAQFAWSRGVLGLPRPTGLCTRSRPPTPESTTSS